MKSVLFGYKFLFMSFMAIHLALCTPDDESNINTGNEVVDDNSGANDPIVTNPCESGLSITLKKIGDDITRPFENGGFGDVIALNGNGKRVVVGSPWADRMGQASGMVSVYEFKDGIWQQMGTDIIGRADQEWTGFNVAINYEGNIIGTFGKTCRVYQFDGNDWVQLGGAITDKSGEKGENYGGLAMDYSGLRIALGASTYEPFDGFKAGGVRIYQFSEGEWKRISPTLWLEGVTNTQFAGFRHEVSLSADGNRVALGASYKPPNSVRNSYVGVFEFFNNKWDRINLINGGSSEASRVALNSDGSKLTLSSLANATRGSLMLYNIGSEATNIDNQFSDSSYSFYGLSHSISGDGKRMVVHEPLISANDGIYNGVVRLLFNIDNNLCQVIDPIPCNIKINNNEALTSRNLGVVRMSTDGNVIAVSSPNIISNTFDGIIEIYEIIVE